MRTRMTAAVLLSLALLVSACGGDADGDVALGEAFSFTPAIDTTAAYFDITNNSEDDDVLLSADADGFEDVQLHDTVVADGSASMVEQEDGIPIPAGETVTLEPGGLHVMLIGAENDLAAGDEVTISLEFENAGAVELTSTVRDRTEEDPQPMEMDMEGEMDMEEGSMDGESMDEDGEG
ncbi:copper chaperone PCu(A)C [Euzebya tangerina]|uniref:copper chaperone PCu(A)C n=1 Tax=Euzebya tangerina TaxID=591198 RepID=UPI000E313F5C|nr:copper chaperone PCu(A)C [Euzebya tangerina]